MNYRLVPFEDELGLQILAYRVDLQNGLILLVPKHLIDSGQTTIADEIESLLRSLNA